MNVSRRSILDSVARVLPSAVVCLFALALPASAQVAPPTGWRWGTEHPSGARIEWNLQDTSWTFQQMAPGWHITTKSGALMHDRVVQGTGRYAVESVQILFPGASQSGYGLFIGGREMESATPGYLAFLVRRDGHVAIEERNSAGSTLIVPWTAAVAIQRVTGDSTARNVLRVAVDADSLRFDVNNVRAVAIPRGDRVLDGHFGFRTGPEINLHVTTLDYIRRLAPVPKR